MIKIISYIKAILIFALIISVTPYFAKHEIVVVIPSYNNAQWCEGNLESLFQQDYDNWRAIFLDDCSKDGNGQIAEQYVQKKGFANKVKIIQNQVRKKALANLVEAIRSCKDNELIVLLDGDDQLAHPKVLSYIDNFYTNNNVWITFGNFAWRSNKKTWECVRAYSDETIANNMFREEKTIVPSHLRTFYTGLFKKIKDEDLKIDGEYFDMTWDLAIMLPMLEMAGKRHAFIPEVLYDYNDQNAISDFRIDLARQLRLNKYIRELPKYKNLDTKPF